MCASTPRQQPFAQTPPPGGQEPVGPPSLTPVLVIWAASGLLLLAVTVTYGRLPPSALESPGSGGWGDGVRRAITLLNFPIALVAIAVVGLVCSRVLALTPLSDRRHRWVVISVSVAVATLCGVALWPGVVTENPVAAQPLNALPIAGVVIAVVLTIVATRIGDQSDATYRPRRSHVVSIVVLMLFAIPWVLADWGAPPGQAPVIGGLLATTVIDHNGIAHDAVHAGHHHGADGVLLAITALLLADALDRIPQRRLRAVLSFAWALLAVYGVAVALNDWWLEQVIKRGWSETELFAHVLWPAPTGDWLIVLALAGVLGWHWWSQPSAPRTRPLR